MRVHADNVSVGQRLAVRFYDRESRGWVWETVEVVRPSYDGGMGGEFVGRPLSGRFAGSELALQYAHVRENGTV